MGEDYEDAKKHGTKELPSKANGKQWNLNTLYRPEMVDLLLDMMHKGASHEQVAREIGVGKQTCVRWCDKYPEWGKAWRAGKDWRKGYFDERALANLEYDKVKGEPEKCFRTDIYKHIMTTDYGTCDKSNTYIIQMGEDAQKVTEMVKKLHKEDL